MEPQAITFPVKVGSQSRIVVRHVLGSLGGLSAACCGDRGARHAGNHVARTLGVMAHESFPFKPGPALRRRTIAPSRIA